MNYKASSFGLSEQTISLIVTTLQKFPEINGAKIFGSRAIGNYKPGSDIDIALNGQISQQRLANIKGILSDEISTPYIFDVVVYEQLDNEQLKNHINQYGIVIY